MRLNTKPAILIGAVGVLALAGCTLPLASIVPAPAAPPHTQPAPVSSNQQLAKPDDRLLGEGFAQQQPALGPTLASRVAPTPAPEPPVTIAGRDTGVSRRYSLAGGDYEVQVTSDVSRQGLLSTDCEVRLVNVMPNNDRRVILLLATGDQRDNSVTHVIQAAGLFPARFNAARAGQYHLDVRGCGDWKVRFKPLQAEALSDSADAMWDRGDNR